MRLNFLLSTPLLFVGLMACGRHRMDSDAPQQDPPGRHSAAFQAGEVAHELSKEAGKAAKAAGRELGKDAHEASEGWSQAQRDDREKKKPEH